MAGAYVELFTKENTDPLTAMTTDSLGVFSASVEKPVGVIRIQYIGYESVLLKAPFPAPLVVAMELQAEEIESVAVQGASSARVTSSGIKFTPTQSQRTLPNLEHYLSKLPFVEAGGGGISVVGRGAAKVYINSRLVDDYAELKDLTMEEVQSVEVIPNPGSIYGADTRAVIKIRTKAKKPGLGGSLTSEVIHSELTEFWNQAMFSCNTPALSFQTSLAYDYDPSRARLSIEQRMRGSSDTSQVNYNSEERQLYRSLVSRNSLVYAPNANNSLGFFLTYYYSRWQTDVVNGLRYADRAKEVEYDQTSHSQSPSHTWKGNLFYEYSKDKIGLIVNFDFYHRISSSDLSSVSSNSAVEPDVTTRSAGKDFLCYTQALGRYRAFDFFSFQLGAEYAYTNVLQTYGLDNPHAVLKSFDITTYQHRYASYATLDFNYNIVTLSAGVRHEALAINRRDAVSQEEFKLFSRSRFYPSTSLSVAKGGFQAQLAYAMKTQYPRYSELRSGLHYSSPYLYESGNPDLLPETRHEVSLFAMYLKSTLMVGYTEIHDEIVQVSSLYSDNIMLYRPGNYGPNKYLSLSFKQGVEWCRFFESTLKANYRAQWMNVEGHSTARGDSYGVGLSNTVNINRHVQCYVNGGYRGAGEVGLFKVPQAWNVDLAVNLSFFSDCLSVYFECSDVFSSLHGKRTYSSESIDMLYDRDRQTRTFLLYVSYRFSSPISSKKYKGNTTNSEMQRL